MKFREYLEEKVGWNNLPQGWTEKSVEKFAKSLAGKEATKKGFFNKWMEKIKGHLDDPEAFCASLKDQVFGSTMWRGKGKTEKEAKADVARDKRK